MCMHGNYHNVRQIFLTSGQTLKFTFSSSISLAGNSFWGYYTNNTSAASIGAVGSLILSPPLCLLCLLIPSLPGAPRPDCLDNSCVLFLIMFIVFPLYSTVIGVIGTSVLLSCHVDLGGIDISNAAVAGVAGGTLLIVPAYLFAFFPSLIFCIISSIWSAIMRLVKWVHVKLAESWMDRPYSSRRDDPEINMGFQIPPGRE